MNEIQAGKSAEATPKQTFSCTQCGATFAKHGRLKEHETAHTGARPCVGEVAGCGRSFTRKAHLSRHVLQHGSIKQFKCKFSTCSQSFANAGKLKRHVGYAHGDKDQYFKCQQPNCSLTFRKRRLFKLHLQQHGESPNFKCSKDGCGASFDSHIARKAHEKKHAGYCCPRADCQVIEVTWSKLQKHLAKHPVSRPCRVCKKEFKKVDSLRRHKRIHSSHKPVLVCPRDNCQAYFSTTFNLQHHIRKVHLELLKYRCPFADCPRVFAMRESLSRHLIRHDPSAVSPKKRQRPKKWWQRRLNGHQLPLVEENLNRLFALRMRLSRRTKVETNLSGLFNERKIPHYVDPEVNLRSLFTIKRPAEKPEAAKVK